MNTQRCCLGIIAQGIVLMCTAFLNAENLASWPNWMGPKRDGISLEKGWSTQWPEKGLSERWSREIGIGFSSISISDGRVISMGHMAGEEIVWAMAIDTGEVLWSFRYPSELNDNLHDGGPAATPTIEGDRVYTLGKGGQLHCFNVKTGEVHWKKELTTEYEVPTPEWGFSSSPVIIGDQLLLEVGRVVSIHKLTGERQWQTNLHKAGYGSVALIELPEQPRCLATLDCDGLRIVKLDSGEEVAFRAWKSIFRTNATTPIVSGNRIFISSGYNVGCGLFEFNGTSLQDIYTNKKMRNHFNNCILLDGYLYGFDGNSNLGRVVQLTCLNFATGEVAWQKAGFGCGSLMIANNKLLILSEEGTLVVAKASPEKYEELSRSSFLTDRCWTVPVLFDRHIYGRNAVGKLKCVELPAE
jgi:outer membrane protein assembly factor BamB